ncbi:pyridoxal-phosphate dependent protein [Ancylostoma ceylanicum]|uniref:Pyridoxal-phosphate dependent protein n=1 Tax=Ancylostoma ceylanicum TaxID=53326 RepID=A0A0D6MBC5_9BILA|nr:pyridoxal-phosphate dependent protein [Ancylostoma ceylanicum]
MGNTPLIKFQLKGLPNVDIFFKNETATKTQSLKHRFSWALLLWAIIEGKVNSKSTVYDSTSGNTGASEAYMCTLVGLPFIAVVAKEIEQEKINQITSNGGKIMKRQKLRERFMVYRFTNESGTKFWKAPGVAGIGYGYNVKPVIYGETTSLTRSVVDESMKMPDIASVAAMHVLRERGIGGGASTGLNFLVSIHKAYQLKDSKDIKGRLTIVTIICDPAEFYESTYFNPKWIDKMFADKGGMEGLECWKKAINNAIDTGSDFLEEGLAKCPDAARVRRSLYGLNA